MHNRKRQQGLTFISWLVILIVLGFIMLIVLKITPVYLEHYAVKTSLESLKNEPLISRKPITEIRKMLTHRLSINEIHGLSKDSIILRRTGGITTVTVKYEQ